MNTIQEFHTGDTKIFVLDYSNIDTSLHVSILNDDEKKKIQSFKSAKRKGEFIATRILKHHLFGNSDIKYHQSGVPYIEGKKSISISHANKFVAFGINDHYRIGIDIEVPRSKILRLYSKFADEKELKLFSPINKVSISMLWSFKETLFKLSKRKGIIFKDELKIDRMDNKWIGTIIFKNQSNKVELDLIETEYFILTANKGELVEEYTF